MVALDSKQPKGNLRATVKDCPYLKKIKI